MSVEPEFLVSLGLKNGRFDYQIDSTTSIDALKLISFDGHTCDFSEECQKEIMKFIKEEIQNINVEFLATRVIRDNLFNKENKKL